MAGTTKRWRVRGPRYGFRKIDGKYLLPGAVFDATEEEVSEQRYKLEEVDQFAAPDLPPRAAPEPAAETGAVRRHHTHHTRMMVRAPHTTVV